MHFSLCNVRCLAVGVGPIGLVSSQNIEASDLMPITLLHKNPTDLKHLPVTSKGAFADM